MAKKTKKEKIIADLRRQIKRRQENTTIAKDKPSTTPEYSVPKQTKTIQITKPAKTTTAFVIGDLRKSFLITLILICFEFVLFWLYEKGGGEYIYSLIN